MRTRENLKDAAQEYGNRHMLGTNSLALAIDSARLREAFIAGALAAAELCDEFDGDSGLGDYIRDEILPRRETAPNA